MTRVFLLEDHELVRRAISHLINASDGLDVVGESATIHGALAEITATRPDVAVLDVQLPHGSGIELCRLIRSTHPEVACLMFTAHDNDAAALAAVMAGAAGYVIKSLRGQDLIATIHRVAQGENLITDSISRTVRARLSTRHESGSLVVPLRPSPHTLRRRPPAPGSDAELTGQQRQLLSMVTKGLTNRQISQHLELSEATVAHDVSALLRTLGLISRPPR